ncbi:GNAT family N-acetyltransferase [Chitinimonas lacunae]|uniref:GNAT family N-acetyltransferase n=1 Tax=Chitinimonas lacunae TaxID=1963018 RepID=A0ABV8MIV1_9NEIS
MTRQLWLRGERIVLRQWHQDDLVPFARLNADPQVRRFFPSRLTRAESDAEAARAQALFAEKGWGFLVLELPEITEFAGVIGLFPPPYQTHFTPCIEIGWRLLPEYWGQGYATEAAQRLLDLGFAERQLMDIVAMTAVDNRPSRAVMERLGMQYDPTDDFDHPSLPEGHPLRRHVLYRLKRRDWKQRSGDAARVRIQRRARR